MTNHRNRRPAIDWDVASPEAAKRDPSPVRHLTYPGDRTAALGQIMGPTDTFSDEFLTVVEAQYFEYDDTTRLGLAYGLHEVSA